MRSSLVLMLVAAATMSCGGDGGPGTGPGQGQGPDGPKLTIVSGDRQTDTVGRVLPLPLTVVLKDTLGHPIAGAKVAWGVVSGAGSVAPDTVVTDANGQATASYTLGHLVKLNSVRAYATEAVAPVFFTQFSVHDVAAQLLKTSGDSQFADIGLAVINPYVVRVADQFGNGVGQAQVQWAVTAGGGSVSTASSVSDTTGTVRTTHTLGAVGGNTVTVSAVGFTAAPLVFTSQGVLPATLVAQIPVPSNYGAHDTYVRDGIAFFCAWNTGVLIYDVGNGMRGGSPSHPVEISRLITADNGVPGGPSVHNAWWFHNPVSGENRYLFIGQEGIGVSSSTSSGDIHVVDVSDLANPVEVGYFTMPNAGTHNFWMDEANQVLYAGYYAGGVVAIDVSGTLQGNISSRKIASIQPGGPGETATWGVMLYNGSIYASDIASGFYQLKLNGFNLNVVGGGHNIDSNNGISTDLWLANGYAYTGFSGRPTEVIIWRLDAAGAPVKIGTVPAPTGAFNLADVEVSPDGKLLMFAVEGTNTASGYYFYNLSDPANPKFVSRYQVSSGLHTATFSEINGRLYAFGARDPSSPAFLILDVTSLDF
jgi:hypothetical protein